MLPIQPLGEDCSAPPPSPVELGHYTMEDYFNDGYYSDVVVSIDSFFF